MGADQPKTAKTSAASQKFLSPFLIGTAIFIIVVALFKSIDFSAASDNPNLSPKEEAKLQKRLREIDEAEQYALIAEIDGWYPCLHSGRAVCYLHTGEVWKYGVTSKGKYGRYKAEFLSTNKVSYLVEFRGNIAECLKQEQIQLFNYPYLPENLARPIEERLPRPPYNPIMR